MSISESRFNMWRAVTAMIHVDDVVRPHEINFILENTKSLTLSKEQLEMLTEDLRTPGNIEEHFSKITLLRDKEDFFHLARAIAWSDGEFDEREQEMLGRIRALPMAPRDSALLEQAMQSFNGLYIESVDKSGEKTLLNVIRGLWRNKKAA